MAYDFLLRLRREPAQETLIPVCAVAPRLGNRHANAGTAHRRTPGRNALRWVFSPTERASLVCRADQMKELLQAIVQQPLGQDQTAQADECVRPRHTRLEQAPRFGFPHLPAKRALDDAGPAYDTRRR